MKKILLYSIYSSMIMVIVLGIFLIVKERKVASNVTLADYDYSYDILGDLSLSVLNELESSILVRPYDDSSVKIVRKFYDRNADEKDQINSITSYEDTYMQNFGVSYSNNKSFEVLASLEGEVTEVLEDDLVGNSITIKHGDNMFTVYQSVTDIKVKQGDHVKQGQIIATTGTSNLSKELNNHLYFELIIDGNNVNPEEYYDKEL